MGAKSNASTTGKTAQDSSLQWVWNGNVPITPILMWRLCRGLFLKIPLMREKPVSCAITCVFHQVMETHLQRNNYYRETEYSNKFIVYCAWLSPFHSNVVGSLTNWFWARYFFPNFSNNLPICIHLLFWMWYRVNGNNHPFFVTVNFSHQVNFIIYSMDEYLIQ